MLQCVLRTTTTHAHKGMSQITTMLQCVAVCCSVCCSACSELRPHTHIKACHTEPPCCSVLQCVAVCVAGCAAVCVANYDHTRTYRHVTNNHTHIWSHATNNHTHIWSHATNDHTHTHMVPLEVMSYMSPHTHDHTEVMSHI